MCIDGYLCCCCSRTVKKDQTAEDNTPGEDQDSNEVLTVKMAASSSAEGEESAEDHTGNADPEGETDLMDPAGTGLSSHLGPVKQLHSGTGHNLAVSPAGVVYGTRDPFSSNAVLEITAVSRAEVQIMGKVAQAYIAMNERGKVYAEEDSSSENTIWLERFEDGWNNYIWKGHPEEDWFLGIKKSGKPKRGDKTRPGQKAVRFLPRPAYPQNY